MLRKEQNLLEEVGPFQMSRVKAVLALSAKNVLVSFRAEDIKTVTSPLQSEGHRVCYALAKFIQVATSSISFLSLASFPLGQT